MKGPRQVGRDVLRLDAEPSARDVPGLDVLPHDLAGGLGRDGKTDTQGTASRFRIDGGVDANQPPGGIDPGAAGLARVDRSVGLDQSEERCVGKECVRTCKYWGDAFNLKK